MKTLGKIIIGFAIFVLLLVVGAKVSGNGYLIKGLWASYLHGNNSATIDDAKYFKTNIIHASDHPAPWPVSARFNKSPLTDSLQGILTQTKSVAFVVVQNDSVLMEKYWEGYSDSSQSNSFSMAKSITTMLAQIAIQKGIFSGWDQKVNSILYPVDGPHGKELQLWHLSTMSSGLKWDENYHNPFDITAKAYYGSDVRATMMGLPIVDVPGKTYNYQSGSTQLLALCLMTKTGKSLAELASEWLWKPMQAERDAKWHTDDKGAELAYCCFNSNARDFARFGKLMLHHGNWNGTQILDSAFTVKATTGALVDYYGYSFWLDKSHGTPIFYQRGILGQYIISIPEYNAVIVRLGHQRLGNEDDNHPKDYHIMVREVLKMLKK